MAASAVDRLSERTDRLLRAPAGDRRPGRRAGRQNDLLEPDEEEIEEDTGGPLAAVGYTVVWYGVPVVLFVLYMLVLNGASRRTR